MEDYEERWNRLIQIINDEFGRDEYLVKKKLVPLNSKDDIFFVAADGVLLCKMINTIQPLIPASKLAFELDLTPLKEVSQRKRVKFIPDHHFVFHLTQNINAFIGAAHKFPEFKGINLVTDEILNLNVDGVVKILSTLYRCRPIIRLQQNLTSCKEHPFFTSIMAQISNFDKSPDTLSKLSPEEFVLKWLNFHLLRFSRLSSFASVSMLPLPITNWVDLKDGLGLLILLKRVGTPSLLDNELIDAALSVPSKISPERIHLSIENSRKLKCQTDVTSREIVSGDGNTIFSLVASIFEKYPLVDEQSNSNSTAEETIQFLRDKVARMEKDMNVTLPTQALEELRNLGEKNHQLENKVLQLEFDKSKFDHEIQHFRDENSRLKEKIQELQNSLAQEKNSNIMKAIVAVDSKFQSIQDKYLEMLNNKDFLISQLENNIHEKAAEIKRLQSQYQAQYTLLQGQIEEERRRNKEKDSIANMMQEVINQLQQDFQKVHEEIDAANKRADEVSSALAKAQIAMNERKNKAQNHHQVQVQIQNQSNSTTSSTSSSLNLTDESSMSESSSNSSQSTSSTSTSLDSSSSHDHSKHHKHSSHVGELHESEKGQYQSLKKDYLDAKDEILSLESKLRGLENDLDTQKEKFKKLDELRRSEKDKFLTLSSPQHEDDTLSDIYQLLLNHLGDKVKSSNFGYLREDGDNFDDDDYDEPLTMADKIKDLTELLLDTKVDLQQRINNLEFIVKKNKEINDIMKQKVETYVMLQISQKKMGKKIR